MFKIVKLTLFQFPSVVAVSVVAREHAAGGGADLFRRFQFALIHSLPQPFRNDSDYFGSHTLPAPNHVMQCTAAWAKNPVHRKWGLRSVLMNHKGWPS